MLVQEKDRNAHIGRRERGRRSLRLSLSTRKKKKGPVMMFREEELKRLEGKKG